MKCLALIEELRGVLEEGHKIPFANKIVIDKEMTISLLNEIETSIPDDIKKAQEVLNERQRILIEAQQEGEGIIKQAEVRINQMISENEITKQAKEKAEEIINEAKKMSRDIRLGANEYAQNILSGLEESLEKTLSIIKNGKNELTG